MGRRIVSKYEHLRLKREREEAERSANSLWNERIAKLAAHPETKLLVKENHPKAWAYVEQMFPLIAELISNTKIYKNTNTAFCDKIGVPRGAGGLFVKPASAILVCWNKDRIPDDVVIVHEMLHFSSQLLGSRMASEEVEEYFAYVKSIPYLISRGFDKKWIAEEYLFHYHYGKVLNETAKKLGKEVHKLGMGDRAMAKEETIRRTMGIIDDELGVKKEQDDVNEDRFDFL